MSTDDEGYEDMGIEGADRRGMIPEMDFAAMLDGMMEHIIKESQPTSYGVGVARGRADERARCIAEVEALRDDAGEFYASAASWLNEAVDSLRSPLLTQDEGQPSEH